MLVRPILFALTLGLLASTPAAAQPASGGYLPADAGLDPALLLSPPPAPGAPAAAADTAAYVEAARGVDGERWRQAIADNPMTLPEGAGQFRCAVGVRLTAANAPAVMRLLQGAAEDAASLVETAKVHFARERPYRGDAAARVCIDFRSQTGPRQRYAYPSGHSTIGATWGLILAELAPDRTAQIMSRVRDFSLSRVVCRLHYPSDTEAGHLLAAAIVARMHAEPRFQQDMAAARREVAAARAAAPGAPQGCPAR